MARKLSNVPTVETVDSTATSDQRFRRETWVDGDGVRWAAVYEYDRQLSRWVLVSRFEAEHA
jgi:hypothetical protein